MGPVAVLNPAVWNPAIWADVIVAFHLGLVLYVLIGQIAVIAGGLLRWGWVRSPMFRWTHLVIMVFVAVQGAFGRICPLTIWEHDLRVRAGQEGREGTFIGQICRDVLFVEVRQETLNIVYIAFAAMVVLCFFLIRPRPWRARRPSA